MNEQECKYQEARKIMNLSRKQRRIAKKILLSIDDYPPAQFLLAALVQSEKKKCKKADIMFKKALLYYLNTTNYDEAERIARLASYYHFGLAGITQDLSKSFKLFTLAANKNDPKAQLFLSSYYNNGIIVERDMTLAVKWVEKAAAQNDSDALYTLGHCYAVGHGVEKDINKAKELLEKSISLGNKKAVKLYRTMYLANLFE